jgi:DNA-binding beta-propeller fold protein YncE
MKLTGRRAGDTTREPSAVAFGLRLAIACIVVMLSACAGRVPLLQRAGDTGPQWPEKPFVAQIEWVKSVATVEDAGIARHFWRKVADLFTGNAGRLLVQPYGVLFDDAGRLFVADSGAGTVHLMDTGQGLHTAVRGEGDATLRVPIGLAEDDNGGLYITDSMANAVYRYDLARRTLSPFLKNLERPTGIVYNRANKLLYISETTANRIIAVDGSGVTRYRIEGKDDAARLFNHPTDIAVDGKGQVYVTDPLNYKIRVFTPAGLPVLSFGAMGDSVGELNKPKGVAVDSLGRIYVCDALLDVVQVFDAGGKILLSFGATGNNDGDFWMPSGIFIRGRHIFVADTYNQRIQIFKYRLAADADSDATSGVQPGIAVGENGAR